MVQLALCSPLPLVLMFFKLEKKAKKRKTHGKSKSKTSKPKKTGSKIKWENKGTSKRVKKWEKNGLVHLHFCCFFLLFRFAFFLLLFCFYFAFCLEKSKIKAKKKRTKSKSKKQKKSKKNANGQVHFFPIFSPFCLPFFPFFSLLFCFCAFWILLICFLVFPFFLHFSRFFSSFKKIRINGGLVNLKLATFLTEEAKPTRLPSNNSVV